MTRDYSLMRRTAGRRVAAVAGTAALLSAIYVARTQSIPELAVYDGYWMLLWGTAAVMLAAPVVWRWKRESSLAAVALVGLVGCWAPILISAVRHQMPLMARLKGAWVLAGAGVVGIAAPFGFICLWLAIHEHQAGNGR